MTVTLIDETKTALQEKDTALQENDVTIRSLREHVDKLEASVKTDRKVKEKFGALNTEVCHSQLLQLLLCKLLMSEAL